MAASLEGSGGGARGPLRGARLARARARQVGDIGIEIEAALAFGTGHHGSTRGCLATLNDVAKRRRPRRILDVGTGTGVLAIAAARRFRRSVAAGDIDPVAVEAARDNAAATAPAARAPGRAIGVAHAALRAGAPYDLVFGNILARPLRALAPALRRLSRRAARSSCPACSPAMSPACVSAYRAQGCVSSRRRDVDGWATLLLRGRFSSA